MLRVYSLCLFGFGLMVTGALARPAEPLLIQKAQPDGSVLSVQEFGDENYHYETTSDGYLIVQDSSGARFFADENATPSGYVAQNVNERNEMTRAFLKSLNLAKGMRRHREMHADRYPDQQRLLMENFRLKHGGSKNLAGVMYRPPVPTYTLGDGVFPIFLVSSSDGTDERTFSQTEVALYKDFFNKEGFSDDSHYGSVRDYFIASSKNVFRPTFDIIPVTIDMRMSVAGSNEGNFMKAVVQAGVKAIGEENLSKYDIDKDKIIDGFGVIIAGPEEGSGLWGHMYWYNVYDRKSSFGGYKFDRYFLVSQIGSYGGYNGIGVPIHEFSHVLGLPDFYSSKDGEWVEGPDPYDIMTQGMYNGWTRDYSGMGRQPPKYSAFERESLGWMKIKELKSSDDVYVLQNIDENDAYSISNPVNNDEFYVVEFRPAIGWDAQLKGQEDFEGKSVETGVFVWYINYVASAWDYFPNQGDARRYTLASTLLGTGRNSKTNKFEAAQPERRTYSTFSSQYNVYNMIKVGTERVCFSTKSSVTVSDCPEPMSSAATVSSSSADAESSSAVAKSSATVPASSAAIEAKSSSSVGLASSSSRQFWGRSSSSGTDAIVKSVRRYSRDDSRKGARNDGRSAGYAGPDDDRSLHNVYDLKGRLIKLKN